MPYDPRLMSGIMGTASRLGMDPLDLATIISYETAGSFDPTKAGPTTKWGQHRGLIQFGEPQAKQYGVDWNDPIESQLGEGGAVERYFKENGWQPGMGRMDAYSIVNAGGPGRYNASDTAAGGAPGTVRDKVNSQFGPHQLQAAALLGIDPSTLGQGMFPDDGSMGMSSRGMPPDMMGSPLPNGPVPQYDQRQSVIKQLLGGDIRGAASGMFNVDPNANPRLEAERFGRKEESFSGIGDRMASSMAASRNAPVSWMQVLAGLGSEAGEQWAGGRQEAAQGSADTQLTSALGQELTPERMAQISALDPEMGQKLMMNQRGFEQNQALGDQKFQQALALQENEAALRGPDTIDPTALMQNAQAAGYQPGTPEYEQFIKDQLASEGKGDLGVTINPDGTINVGRGVGQPTALTAPTAPTAPVPATDPNAPLPEAITGAVTGISKPGEDSDRVQYVNPETQKLEEKVIGGSETADAAKNKKLKDWETANDVIRSIDEAMTLSDKDYAAGAWRIPGLIAGKLIGETGSAPGTPGRNLESSLNAVTSNIGFDRLQQMRDASPTGGALGQVTEKELELLQSTIASLDPGQDKEQLQSHLQRVRDVYKAIATGENYEAVMGFPPPPPDHDRSWKPDQFGPKTIGEQPAEAPTINSQEAYDALPSGAIYIEDGKKYKKP